jgi:NAD(P)-dependent dehydrogenase (short-subunit alcohol dehydrogenase family)
VDDWLHALVTAFFLRFRFASVVVRIRARERLKAVKLDVTNEAEAHEAAAIAVKAVGCIDVLVNNDGYGVLGGIEEASAEETQRVCATNVFGLLNVTRAKAFMVLVNARTPPTRLQLGSDTVARVEAENAHVARELGEWRELALSTDSTEDAA